MGETVIVDGNVQESRRPVLSASGSRQYVSLPELWILLCRNRLLFLTVVGIFVFACLGYCLLTQKVYEAKARIALRSAPESALVINREPGSSGSFASGQVQLETLADVFRSEQIAWRVIGKLDLSREQAFSASFSQKFPRFDGANPSPEERDYLLDRFHRSLSIETVPHTLVLEIRFRSHDARLSAAAVNAVIEAYGRHEADARVAATGESAKWLDTQMQDMKEAVTEDNRRLAEFEIEHGIVNSPETLGNSRSSEADHTVELHELDAMTGELIAATAERIQLEAKYRAAVTGDPELVMMSDTTLDSGGAASSVLHQLRIRKSELEQEQTQLGVEHGPNFPRVREIQNQLQDLDRQVKAEDLKIVARLRNSWMTAQNREQMLRSNLKELIGKSGKLNEAELQYAAMREEAQANRQVYTRLLEQIEEARLAAGSYEPALAVIDPARQPVAAASPRLEIYLPIAAFLGLWAGLGVVVIREKLRLLKVAGAVLGCIAVVVCGQAKGQAPTPSTSGLPTGVARIPQSSETRSQPSAQDAPQVWGAAKTGPGVALSGSAQEPPVAGPSIVPGDVFEVTEAHLPEFRHSVRVSETGTVFLPLAGEVLVGGTDERAAARAIESALIKKGMLLHPQVSILRTIFAGQDVSVLGEVARPGLYGYGVHHRLLDLIAAASGLNANAGRLVTITHRDREKPGVAVLLDSTSTEMAEGHNPELLPGDTVQVGRAGLVYVVGDVIRPGGFPADPAEKMTVLEALSLAWGPGQNAALTKAVLIREQPGGRTITTLNLKRMLRGLDPDLPIRDRDLLFVPNSAAKDLWRRSMESVIQSAAGVSIYAGLVYSQRF